MAPTENDGLGKFELADRGLRRTMSFTQLLLLGVSAQIGSGWLFGVLSAAGVAGPAAILAWIIASILVGLIALAYAEIGSMLPRSGAIVRYTYLTHGAFSGWIIGWAYWLSAVTIPPIEAIASITYLGGKYPGLHLLEKKDGVDILSWPQGILLGIVLMILFFILNYFGAKFLSESNRWVTIWKLALPTLTFIGLFFVLDSSNFHSFGGFAPEGVGPIFHAIASSGIIFSLLGFRQALDYGGEVKNPQRNVPLATFGSIAIPMVIYTLLQVAFIGAIRWASMGLSPGDWSLLETGKWADGPFFHALDSANLALLTALGTLLLIDAAVSPLATGWVYLGTATRTSYGMAVHRNIPPMFQANNRFGIPWISLIVSTVVACVFFVPAPSWYQLVGFISAAAVLTYMMGGVGLPVLRRTAGSLPRPFRLKQAGLWSLVGFLASALILYWAGFSTLANVFTATFIGLPLFAGYYAWKEGWAPKVPAVVLGVVFLVVWVWIARSGGWVLTADGGQSVGGWSFWPYFIAFAAALIIFCVLLWALCTPVGRLHIERSAWLLWLLLGTLPISYYGFYGPLKNPPLAFPWGTLIEIVLAISAYFWGVRSGFETDEIKDIVDSVAGDGQLPEEQLV
ncbi:APC family permease [Leekyejoonella antrihumi]|uniref:APC family permease n=1 Tax=Leekyejoonella antrihumi TaxID=1660198 RepID=A0A563DTT5_9MICO|nr:APC family permease [Leekyejoonella antrihumi]TWP33678.1 APC family permease [Leekyejoonella antrihumi]